MKRLLLISVCISLAYPFLAYSQPEFRSRENFDFEWKFILNDSVEASASVYDDSKWEDVQLPHDWSIGLNFDEKNGGSMAFLPGGTGWYRKTFTIPADSREKIVSILFDGVYHQSNVYLNGKHLGFHPYGYTGFEYELGPYLNYGSENVLLVKVDHSNSPSSRWYSGSGIYRHVWLKTTHPIHVANWGTYITTPKITTESAEVKIVVSLLNRSANNEELMIHNRILDSGGKELAATKSSLLVEKGGESESEQVISLKRPILWSIDNPYLYTLETEVKLKGKLIDSYNTPFGVRYFSFDPDKGFFLNGEHIKLKGMNLHQDAGSLGTAVPDQSYLRRLKILKEYGCNAIRCSHNPPSPEFLDMCDSLGFVVIDEIFDKWKTTGHFWGYYTPYFDEWWKKDLDAMLLRDRNHPSIIMWSIGNETTEQNDTTGTGTALLKMLRDYVHETEPNRPVTAAIAPADVSKRQYNENGFNESLDIVGYNYQESWLADDHKRFPDRIMYIAEGFPYYLGRHNAIRDYNPSNPWNFVADNDFMAGQFIWAGVDYLGESSGWPSTGWPTCLFDVCMFEKPRAAFHRAVWNPEPMVRIAVADQSLDIDPGKDHWSWPHLAEHWNFPQYKGHIIEVQTITNCDSVELWVNNASLGKRCTADYPNNTIVWHVPYREGKIEAKGYINGEEKAKYELNTSGTAAKIVLSADRETITADGQDLSHITVHIADEKGIVVPEPYHLITVEVSGSGRLLGLDNGDLRREGTYAGNTVKTYFGKALITVQSDRNQGEIVIRVKAAGLPESGLTISAADNGLHR